MIVPAICKTGMAVCLGGGPSLTQADVEACRTRATVIAINDAYRLAPWADVLYACDQKWWQWHRGALEFPGLRFSLRARWDVARAKAWRVTLLEHTGRTGLELTNGGLRSGMNSGYQAINLAVQLGARRIVLLGYDMQFGPRGEHHWFGSHPDRARPEVAAFATFFPGLVKPLADVGVTVVNCSRRTRLTCFPQQPLAAVFPREAAA